MSGIVDFFKAAAGICQTNMLDPGLWEMQGNRVSIDLSKADELRAGTAVYLSGPDLQWTILVVRGEDDSYQAYENRCTHMGRKLDLVDGQPVLRCCSLSHSTFDMSGATLSGPAKSSVRSYPCVLDNGKLNISIV